MKFLFRPASPPPPPANQTVAPPVVDPLLLVAQGEASSTALAHSPHAPIEAGALLTSLQALKAQICGLEPTLAPLFENPKLSDVLFNAPDQIWVDQGQGLERTPLRLEGEPQLRALAIRLAALAGKRLDDASPIVDGALPGGIRLHALLPPLANPYPAISLRFPSPVPLSFAQMENLGTLPPPVGEVLRAAVSARKNGFISGATGSGKTTLLSSLLELVCPHQRIVCIEEVSELSPTHPHVVHLQERRENIQRRGAVSMSELTKAAMRMRPDRIVLGECRGPEVREVLGAMNTGHSGSWATVHANSAFDVPARLTALGALAGMSPSAVREQVLAGVDLFVHVERSITPHASRRYVSQVALSRSRLVNLPTGKLESLPLVVAALTVSVEGDVHYGPAWPTVQALLEGTA